MKMNLNDLEIRILGCLMEKELTTPENYPLSLNTLVSACNQKSNREPVTNLTEAEVLRGLETLGARGLARQADDEGRRRLLQFGKHSLDCGNIAESEHPLPTGAQFPCALGSAQHQLG